MDQLRLIPARAGRTRTARRCPRRARAHPRSRGADSRSAPLFFRIAGSSPLARGGHRCCCPGSVRRRLIPARAGRTRCRPPRRASWRAHPRSRGADPAYGHTMDDRAGSSPLARGGPNLSLNTSGGPGLIPARAGRTSSCRTGRRTTGAHPRSRGADSMRRSRMVWLRGSSPLARGGLLRRRGLVGRRRLIPARAGRTVMAYPIPPALRAHPRSRGADHTGPPWPTRRRGSSPLARGGPMCAKRERS